MPVPRPTRRDVALAERPGKSWLLANCMRQPLDAGIPRPRILHIELEDDRLAELRTEDLHRIGEAFYSLHPGSHGEECSIT